MVGTQYFRATCFAVALALSFLLVCRPAPADLGMVIGPRVVVTNQPVSDCSAKAKAALNSVLQNAFEAGDGTNQWLAYGPLDSTGHSSATAAIHCYPVDSGYVATLTCAAQVPPNPDTATTLCVKLAAAFPAQNAALIDRPGSVAGSAP